MRSKYFSAPLCSDSLCPVSVVQRFSVRKMFFKNVFLKNSFFTEHLRATISANYVIDAAEKFLHMRKMFIFVSYGALDLERG